MTEHGVLEVEQFQKETEIDDGTLKDLYEGFLEEMLEEREFVIEYFEQKDYTHLSNTIHNIKGVSGSYKAVQLFQVASDLNAMLKEMLLKGEYKEEEIGDAVQSLLDKIEEIKRFIGEYFV